MAPGVAACTKEAIQRVERQLDILSGQRCCLYERLRFYAHEMTPADVLAVDAALADIEKAEEALDDQLTLMMASPAGLALAAEYQQAPMVAPAVETAIPF